MLTVKGTQRPVLTLHLLSRARAALGTHILWGCRPVQVPQGSSRSFSRQPGASKLHLGRNLSSGKKDLKCKDGFLVLMGSKYLVNPTFYCSSMSWHMAGPAPSIHPCHCPQGLSSTLSSGFGDCHESPRSPHARENRHEESWFPPRS